MEFGRAEVSGRNDMRSGDHRRSRFSRWRFVRLIRFAFRVGPRHLSPLSCAKGHQKTAALAARRRLGLKHARGSTPMRNGNSLSKAVKWFAIELPISYEGAEGSLLQGNGRTLAMSSGAIQFACDRNLPVGHIVRLWIQWPATLCDGTSLSLWATGTIQRSASCEAEVAIMRHEFRTRRAGGSTPSILLVARSAR